MEESLCQCGHEEAEHIAEGFYCCNGEALDQGCNIGCYCSAFRKRTAEWIAAQSEYRIREARENWKRQSILYRLKSFLRLV